MEKEIKDIIAEEKNAKKKKKAVNAKKKEKIIPENETPEQKEKEEEKKKKAEAKKKAKPKDMKQATRRLLSYLKDFKGLIVLVCISVVLTTVTNFIASLAMMPVINTIAETVVADNPDISAALAYVSKWLIIMAAGFVISSSLNLIYTRIMLYVSSKTLANMRRDLFNHLQTLPLNFFDGRKTGEIMSRFTNDVDVIGEMLNNTVVQLISGSITLVGTFCLMLYTNVRLTLITVFMIPVMMKAETMEIALVEITAVCDGFFFECKCMLEDLHRFLLFALFILAKNFSVCSLVQ